MTLVLVLALVAGMLPWAGRRHAARLADPPRRFRDRAETRVAGGADAGRSASGSDANAGRRARRPVRARPPDPDPALLLDLVAVALAAGAPVPTALLTVGTSWPGAAGEALVRATRALELGAPWDVAWAGAGAAARAVAAALEPAWVAGASPVPLLRAAADRLRSRRRAETRAAAGRLGVQLVVPLGLCYLPAFVLVGLVPVVVSLASGLLG